ncbi:hydroxypyruvate isomerase family protein [Geojedonia litorea]|uniref:Hydroxypyruvate isomerase family protein n=1 Tax=Geojedonia litorea TaxID=1268269 RepID=A0ABV9N760_9FLAO
MNRRRFVQNTLLSATATAVVIPSVFGQTATSIKTSFKLKFAPHDGMFKHQAGDSFLDQIKFMSDQGFTAIEDNDMRNRPIAEQEAIGKLLSDLNMDMGVFVAHKIYWDKPNLASGDLDYRKEFLKDIENAIGVAKRTNAKWMTIVPGYVDLRLHEDYQTANVVKSLKQACALLEPHNLTMVLEPLNFRNHPGMFLTRSPQAYQICKAVNSSSCKILYDVYHQQIQEGNLIPNIEACWDEIAYFQVGDNPGRNEPTTGEINFTNVFKFIHNKGYEGIIGMEHGNSQSGKEGELAVINAYRTVSQF